jgi:hypothetical protein
MAQVIKIKRSDSTATPGSSLAKGELGYSYNSNKLFIGDGSTFDVIGGQVYVEMLDHTAGTLTASSAIITDSNSKINNLLVDNIQINGNTISTGSGNLIIDPATGSIDFATGGAIEFDIVDGSATALTISQGSNNYLTFDTSNGAELITFNKQIEVGIDGTVGYTLPTADGSSGQALITNGSGVVSFQTISTTLGIAGDSSSSDSINLVSDDLTFTGSGAVSATVGSDTVTIAVANASSSVKGLASFASANFTVSSGAVSAKNITFTADTNSTTRTLGGTLNILGGEAIDTSASAGTITIAVEDSSATNKGAVIVSGGEGIDVSYSSGTATVSGEDATTSNKGIASFNSNDFSVSSGAVSIASISNSQIDNSSLTIGSTSINLGATASSLAGLSTITATGAITGGSLVADNLTLNGNELSSTNTNGNISLNPNGSGSIDANSANIINVADPTQAQHAATKAYVDAVKQALDIKDSVRVATTANITISTALNADDTLDGVTLVNGDRVLVKDQSSAGENGIYVVGTSPARSADANTAAELTGGTFVFVEEGTVNGDNGFVFTHDGTPSNFGTTAMPVVQFSGAGQVIAGDALSKSGNTINVNDDNKTIEISGDTLRIKGITQTAVGDLLIGAASNGGYTRLAKPGSNGALLTMGTSGAASWTTTIDGGTF